MPVAIPEKRALVLNLKDPERVKALIPMYQVVEDGGMKLLVVPHNLDTLRILRNIGVNVKGYEPMRFYYQYPLLYGRYPPMLHQIETAVAVTTHKRLYILNEMRTGKSAAVLWATNYLKKMKAVRGVLITCTRSCMDTVWRAAIFGLFPEATVAILHGDRATRLKLLAMKFDYYVINHDGLKTIPKELYRACADGRINMGIIDEGSEFAQQGTTKWKVLKAICSKLEYVNWLTGTPMSRGPDKIWGQCMIVTPDTVPESFTTWKDSVLRQVATYTWVPRLGYEDKVYKAMQPAVRYRKSEVIDTMPVTYEDREAGLTDAQNSAIKEIKKEGALVLGNRSISAVNAAIVLNKIVQISMGAVLDDKQNVVAYPPTKRLAVLDEIISQANAKVIVFAPYHAVIDLIVAHLSKYTTVEFIDGRVTGNKRSAIINAFQHDENPRVLVAHPKPAGHGLELAAADTVIWFGPLPVINSTDLYEQACHRVMSAQQKNNVGIYHIFCTSLERKYFDAQRKGVAAQMEVLKLFEEVINS